ncbi:MT-A70-domain-containing protein [Ramaria rubella]|nr:MT-A70-domain-containing protein [Ramaria rubella]
MALSSTMRTLSDINDLLSSHAALTSRVRASQRSHRDVLRTLPSPPYAILQLPLIPTPSPSPSPPPSSPSPTIGARKQEQEWERERDPKTRTDLPPEKRVRLARYPNYVPEEETLRNDYSQRYVDGGEWPQNWVLGAELEKRFEEYPKQQRLLTLKRAAVDASSLRPHYLPLTRLRTMAPAKFDVILIDPPFYSPSFSWDALTAFPITQLAGDPSFVFMWVGSGAGDGLERGREVLARWGYRRCEDVVWVKTNKECNKGPGTDPPTSSLLTRTKQHCLMGIRGTVRRSTDNWFVHCNIGNIPDTDVIIWEGDPEDPTRKPPEMYSLIESFCLGARRLEIFGRRRPGHLLRRGWVTVLLDDDGDMGAVDRVDPNYVDDQVEVDSRASSVAEDEDDDEVEMKTEAEIKAEEELLALKAAEQSKEMEGLEGAVLWQRERWEREVRDACQVAPGGRAVVPSTPDIDNLRPKSPIRGGSANNNNNNFNSGGAAMSMAGGPGMSMGMGMPNRPMSTPQHFAGGIAANAMGLGGPGAGPYPMMGPPMRIGPGVMNPTMMQNQMPMGMGMPNAGMMGMGGPGMPMGGMMMPQMGMGMGMGMMPQMMGMGGPGMGAMGMNMGSFVGDGGFPQGGFQNGFGGQPGFGGQQQMNGGWGPF